MENIILGAKIANTEKIVLLIVASFESMFLQSP